MGEAKRRNLYRMAQIELAQKHKRSEAARKAAATRAANKLKMAS